MKFYKGVTEIITVYEVKDDKKWDEIVRSFNNYDIYYLSSYVKGFQIHGDGTPLLYYFEDESIRAINVVMKRDISENIYFNNRLKKNSYFDLSTPYGYGGFIFEGKITGENIEKINKTYEQYNIQNNIISEFVRLHPIIANKEYLNKIYKLNEIGETITINLTNKEQIWNNFTSKNRNVIRKAIKNDVVIKKGFSKELIDKFIPMYNKTMDKDNATNYYYFDKNFYSSIKNELQDNCIIFYALYEDQIVSMALILYENETIHYHLSASNPEYNRLAATNLLLFEVAKWGSENNFTKFHLGGGVGGKADGLLKFKKAFNKESDTTFFIGKKIFDSTIYQKMIDIRKKNSEFNDDSNFFPKYRA